VHAPLFLSWLSLRLHRLATHETCVVASGIKTE
jgi:hypothetical protein